MVLVYHTSNEVFGREIQILQTASESEARARAALEAEASAQRAARAVTAACESVAQRLANDLGHRRVISKMRKENEALIKTNEELQVHCRSRL